jgi:hypothetical protein
VGSHKDILWMTHQIKGSGAFLVGVCLLVGYQGDILWIDNQNKGSELFCWGFSGRVLVCSSGLSKGYLDNSSGQGLWWGSGGFW